MPFCEYCGIQQSGTAKFCRKCGKPVRATDSNTSSSINNSGTTAKVSQNSLPPEILSPEFQVATTPTVPQNIQPRQEKQKRDIATNGNSSKRTVGVILLIVLCAALFVGSWQYYSNNSSKDGSTSSNPAIANKNVAPSIPQNPIAEDTTAFAKQFSIFSSSNLPLNSKCKSGDAGCFFSAFGNSENPTKKFQNDWLLIDFIGNGDNYIFAIDPRSIPTREDKLIRVKVFNSDKRLIYSNNLVSAAEYTDRVVPYSGKRPGGKETDLILISQGGNHSYFHGMELVGFASGKMQSLLTSLSGDTEWEDANSSVTGMKVEQSANGKIFLKYRRSIRNWNGGEYNRPYKAYIREIIWNSKEAKYGLGPETTI